MAKQKKLIDEHHYKIVLQQLAETEFAGVEIDAFDIERFSSEKTMFSYQQEALENALRVLKVYFETYKADKSDFYHKEYSKYAHANLDFVKPTPMLQEYYPILGNRVEFAHFINRMSFWMTMGSGKTIVIIKLVELLERMMALNFIPRKTILFFTANEGLLDRFEKEVEEYNALKSKTIETISLKDYEQRQKYGTVFDTNIIKLFCYRADLMAEETKENILDYRDVLNDGNNYVILDEAHKGDKQDSKRQNIFSILSQNGFLFNFSATFTDERDIVTTVYNLNQAVWVKKGYGKKLFLLDNDLKSFKNKTDLNDKEKQKSLIKSLILLSFAKKHKKHISTAYHEPMMVVFTNSVNTDDADAKLFFRQIKTLCNEKNSSTFDEAKHEIVEEFKQTKYLVTDEKGEGVNEFAEEIAKLGFNEMKTLVFHQSVGNIEAIVNPKDKGEIAFKLDSADKPFGLLKIGDTTSWKNDELSEIKITDTYKEESYFKSLDESSINILIGSRSFYEGWDTTRPNIMLFLNIGMDKEAKKFVTQSIGRGMRVESVDGSRQRLSYIDASNKADLKEDAKALETLFVISTNKDAIEHIVHWQEEQNKGIDWAEVSLEKNDLDNQVLYVPKYNKVQTSLDKVDTKRSFKLSEKNKIELEIYTEGLSQELFSFRHEFYDKKEYEIFFKLVKSNKILNIDNTIHYTSLDFLIEKLKNRLYVNISKVDKFKQLENEIVHFRKIKVREDKKDDFLSITKQAMEMQNLSNEEVFKKATQEGIELSEAVEKYQKKEILYDGAKFLKLSSYYYVPVISQENSDWMKNIISVPSEVVFLNELVSIIKEMDTLFDWWRFSKLNDYHDKEIFIPYIENGVEKPFYPDFIFWLQKDNRQMIVFIDPKGMKHTDYEHKVDGYEELFEDGKGALKQFKQQRVTIEVKLSLYNIKHETPGKKYKRYWVDKGDLKDYFTSIESNM